MLIDIVAAWLARRLIGLRRAGTTITRTAPCFSRVSVLELAVITIGAASPFVEVAFDLRLIFGASFRLRVSFGSGLHLGLRISLSLSLRVGIIGPFSFPCTTLATTLALAFVCTVDFPESL